MIDVLYDCDLTMGLPGRDVDDGLALMALLGNPKVRLAGVTSTYGNGTLEEVHPCLEGLLQTLGSGGTPCRRGASSAEIRTSPAARFLAETAERIAGRGPERVRLLATGSAANLYAAALQDPQFFGRVAEVVLMGGVTGPLAINGRVMAELNFACDPEAAFQVLHSSASETRITIITGNLCLQGFLERHRFLEGVAGLPSRVRTLLTENVAPWLAWYRKTYGLEGFHPWDAIAALYLTDPDLFEDQELLLCSDVEDLRSGRLRTSAVTAAKAAKASGQSVVNLPARLRDPDGLHDRLFAAWARLGERLEGRGGGGP